MAETYYCVESKQNCRWGVSDHHLSVKLLFFSLVLRNFCSLNLLWWAFLRRWIMKSSSILACSRIVLLKTTTSSSQQTAICSWAEGSRYSFPTL